MTADYTLDEIRRLADTNPEKLAQEYQASRAATANLVDRARAGIAARSGNPPTNKFQAWAQGYGNRFIYSGSFKPVMHMMLIVGGAGCAVEYWCHHRALINYEELLDRNSFLFALRWTVFCWVPLLIHCCLLGRCVQDTRLRTRRRASTTNWTDRGWCSVLNRIFSRLTMSKVRNTQTQTSEVSQVVPVSMPVVASERAISWTEE